LRVVAVDQLDEPDPSSRLVARLTAEKVRRPSAPRIVEDARSAPSSSDPAEPIESLRVDPDAEPDWGVETEARSSGLWLLLGAASLAVVLLGAGALLLRPGNPPAPSASGPVPKAAEDPLKWYRENPDLADSQSEALLEAFVGATTVEEVLDLVRERHRVEPLLRERWQPLASALRSVQPNMERGFAALGGVAFFLITAELEDFRKLRVYFVRENGKMKLDWEASVAHSPLAVAEMANSPGLRNVKLRCIIEAQPISIPSYPGSEYNGYLLAVPGYQKPLWGLAKIGSEVDEALLDSLDRGRFLLDLKTSERVTVEVEEAPGAPSNYLLISKLNHVEWVAP
jgi:hypothetical protein